MSSQIPSANLGVSSNPSAQVSILSPSTAKQSANVLLAITGGIAAYKSAVLARLLIKAGHTVRVMMTDSACEFISPLTLQALTGHEVHTTLLDVTAERGMGHIELAKWADVLVIAPASANTIAKIAHGQADNLVTTVCLATTAPIVIAPAMNQAMYANRAVQDNLDRLRTLGHYLIAPESGEQACGDVGQGRLPEPEVLCEYVLSFINREWLPQTLIDAWAGKRVVITAGATLEPIDPVRFLSNHSTGKMGYALARACADVGAKVTVVAGKGVHLDAPIGVEVLKVGTALEMLACCRTLMSNHSDTIFIAAAAVADYCVANVAEHKIKKTSDDDALTLKLIKNPDILATMSREFDQAIMVGFAAETQDTENYARTKLVAKGLDMIAVNDVSDRSIGFGADDNAMTVFFADKYEQDKRVLSKASKAQIAHQLIELIGIILRDSN